MRYKKAETVETCLFASSGSYTCRVSYQALFFRGIVVREDRLRKRNSVLPADRICPHCDVIKPNSRQWIITELWKGCKSCWMIQKRKLAK